MADTADVVVVGAGIVGASIAWHLARAGCRDVLVLEREAHQGLGSTGKSMGGVRAQFSTNVNIRLSLYSIPFYSRFEAETGHPAGYRAHGYLLLATSASQFEYLRANHARQRALGLSQAVVLTADDVQHMVPQLRIDDVAGATFCPTDGFVDPYSVMNGFTRAAADLGVRLRKRTEVCQSRRRVDAFRVSGRPLGSSTRDTWCSRPGHGPRRSREPRAWTFRSCHTAACSCRPSRFQGCPNGCRW